MASETESAAPKLEFEVLAVEPVADGSYVVSWRITNESGKDVLVLETWLPHGAFYADKEQHSPQLRIDQGRDVEVSRRVRSQAASEASVENTFLILLVDFAGSAWRIFVRMRVEAGASSVRPIIEAVTAQSIGFASE